MSKKQELILSLGGNIGDTEKILKTTIEKLEEYFNCKSKNSSFYKTKPWGFEAKQDFINCITILNTNFEAFETLRILQKIEKEIGRTKKTVEKNYQSRVIDIDIIYFGQQVIVSETLTIPHKLRLRRTFVTTPLLEIFPDVIDPIHQKKIKRLVIQNGKTTQE